MTFTPIKSAIIACLALGAMSGAAMAKGPSPKQVNVIIDQTQILNLKYPAGSLIVGNPDVAGVAVHDDRTLLLTGRAFGSTNLIVLDAIGRIIFESQISVGENVEGNSLTIARGLETETYSCTGKCRVAKTDITD